MFELKKCPPFFISIFVFNSCSENEEELELLKGTIYKYDVIIPVNGIGPLGVRLESVKNYEFGIKN